MAANKPISVSDLDQAIDFTIAESDTQRADALAALQRVLCAEAIPLDREHVRLTEKFGAADPRVAQAAELLEINKAFTREVVQETVRAQIGVPVVEANAWIVHGFVRDLDGNGLADLTIAPYDSIKPGADWVKELGRACTDDRGYFKLEASIVRDYSATPVYLHALNAAGATLYKDAVALTPKGGQLNYREFVISGKSLDCPPPPPSPPPDLHLSITIADSPDPVTPDSDLVYTLTVSNLSQIEAKDLKVTDTLPAQTAFTSASGDGFTCTHTNGSVSCTLPGLAAGATGTITIVVKVSQDVTHGTVLNNTATVTATASDPNTTKTTGAATTTVVSAADLSITKIDEPDPVVAGQNVTYTLQVTNPVGASAAQNVTVTDAVPANTAFVSAAVTNGAGWTAATPAVGGSGDVVFSKASLAPGETAAFQVVVKVNSDTSAASISNTATVASPTVDPSPANNSVTATTVVKPSADLSITKIDEPDPVVAGQNVTYTLQVTNPVGASAAQNVTVTDVVPANTAFVSAVVTSGAGWTAATPAVGGAGDVVFSKASLAPGETAAFQIVVKVNSDTSAASISNTATVASPTVDPSPANNSVTATTVVKPSADLSITKIDEPDPVVAGQNVTYTLQVTNPVGASAAQKVTVMDATPANTVFVSAVVTSGAGWTAATPAVGGAGDVVFSKASLAPGETAAFQIVVKVNSDTSAASISNTATVASPTIDPSPANNSVTATTVVKPSADLKILKTDDPNSVAPGGNVTYTLNVTNAGPSAAQKVTVMDATPANTVFVSAVVTSGAGWTAATPAVGGSGAVVFSKASVAAGETAAFRIVVNVNQNTPESAIIINTATVTSPTSDPNADNTAITRTNLLPPSANLSITKIVSIERSGDITYILAITNNGPNVAKNVKVTDPIPANTTFVSATGGKDWTATTPAVGGAGDVVFSKASVAPGETANFQIVVKLNPNTPAATINNTATVTSSTTNLDPSHSTVEAIANVQQPKSRRAVIVFTEVNKAGDHTPLQGSPQPSVTFTDNVANSGDLEAAFSSPPSGFKMKQFKGVTMAVVVGPVDADIQVRLKAVVSALQKAGGAATLATSTVVLSASDQTTLGSRKISIANTDEVIFVELAAAA